MKIEVKGLSFGPFLLIKKSSLEKAKFTLDVPKDFDIIVKTYNKLKRKVLRDLK